MTAHIPNGKTLGVLSTRKKMTEIYLVYCEYQTASDGHDKFKRGLIPSIMTLQQKLLQYAHVESGGPKRAPCHGVVFYFGGQMYHGRQLMAHEYIEKVASIAQHIPLECWQTLEEIATTLLREKEMEKQ